MQVCDTKPKPHTICEDGPMAEKRGGTYSKGEAVKMNNTFFFLAAVAKHPCSKKWSLANESISERQRRRRLIRFELCWRAGDISPANSAVPIRKARGSRVCFSGSIVPHPSCHCTEHFRRPRSFFSFFSFLQHCNYLTDREEFKKNLLQSHFLFCHAFFMSPLEGVFGRKENLVQVKLFVQVTHKHTSIMSQEQRLGKWLMFKGIHWVCENFIIMK